MNNLKKFREINTFFFDVDGVLTNNEVILLEQGQFVRKMYNRDSLALSKAVKEGYRIVVLTRSKSNSIKEWLNRAGVREIHLGTEDKMAAFEEIVYTYELDTDRILYMGDDLPDLEPMLASGIASCPSDAAHEIIKISQYVSPFRGGKGCVREVIEKVLTLQDRW